METKSLYTILGVRPDASQDQIEIAYASLLHQLKDDDRTRLVAAKEAYSVLSEPNSRQRYNQKLFAPQTISETQQIVYASSDSWNIPKLLVIGAIVLGAILVYNLTVTDREKLQLQHAKELEDNLIKQQQEARNQQEADRQAELVHQRELEKQAQENESRRNALMESRAIDFQLQQQAQQEARQKLMEQQMEQARQRQAQFAVQQQLARERMLIRDLQNER